MLGPIDRLPSKLAKRLLEIRRRGIVADTIAMLHEAVACGFKDAGRLRNEQAFASIRSTREFQAIMSDLDFPRIHSHGRDLDEDQLESVTVAVAPVINMAKLRCIDEPRLRQAKTASRPDTAVSRRPVDSRNQCEEHAVVLRRLANLATIWQQHWPCHPNATTMTKQ